MKIVKHKVYERYADRIAALHTADGKRPDAPSNLEVFAGLLA
jgi:long-chain acyl-CoA synthetase